MSSIRRSTWSRTASGSEPARTSTTLDARRSETESIMSSAHELHATVLQERAQLLRRAVERLREVGSGAEAVLELIVLEILLPRRRAHEALEEVLPVGRGVGRHLGRRDGAAHLRHQR